MTESLEPRLAAILQRHGIPAHNVIDARAEHDVIRTWRGALGTYEADVPQDLGDIETGYRVRSVVTVHVRGWYPGATILPTTDGEGQQSVLTLHDEGTWQPITDTRNI